MMLANTIPPLSATAAHINPNNGLETVWRAILIKLIDTAMMNADGFGEIGLGPLLDQPHLSRSRKADTSLPGIRLSLMDTGSRV